ncbi:MAG TPA: cobalamin-dependent protein [Vicinamibacteria bacterium]|nr:cobalamin-dependent protein [Vicinamibacteria bacterium]
MDDALLARIDATVADGDAEGSSALARQALQAGEDPLRVLEDGFTAALRRVGERWEAGDLYLPEMILAAEAMKAALAVLQPEIQRRGGAPAAPRCCVLGTVKGDIHDIGKSIVGSMLEAAGFRVVDLGTDVPADRFVAAVREERAGFVGLSALLTTTMPEMRTVVDALAAAGLRSAVRVVIGGAPVTSEYAQEIGADGFARDGLTAMRLFQALAAPGEEEPCPSRP